MRKVLGVMFIVLGVGCQDPQCADGEKKLGTACLDPRATDGTVDGGPGDMVPTPEAERTDASPEQGVRASSQQPSVDGGHQTPDAQKEPSVGELDASTQKMFTCSVPRQCAEWPIADAWGKFAPQFANDGQTVTDLVTKLVWQRRQPPFRGTWAEAKSYCDSLSLGGVDDWRLPSLAEIRSLYDFSQPSKASSAVYLPEDQTEHVPWWFTSALEIERIPFAFIVALSDLTVVKTSPTDSGIAAVRCVRGGVEPAGSRYTISADQSYLTDNWTKLVWRRKVEDGLLTESEAQARCASLGLSWRLPTVKELLSLIDPRLEPTIDLDAFPDTPPAPFWSKDRDFVNKHTASVNFGGWGAWGPGATQVPRQQHRGEDVAHARCVR